MRPITSDCNRMREDFASKLPKQLGQPYIMNTLETPVVFVAFFPNQRHEMQDGSIIDGSELRLLEYGNGFKAKKMLAAIIGILEDPAAVALVGLRDQGTRFKDIIPYQQVIVEMFTEAVSIWADAAS